MAKRKARAKQEIPIDESKADRFARVVKPRVNKAIRAIAVIGFCSGSTYEYKGEQVEQIISGLMSAVNSLSDKFASKAETDVSFEFAE